jgi:hypothetical protein
VAARTTELKRAVAKEAVVERAEVMRELTRIAMADIRDLGAWGGEGLAFRPSTELSDDQARAVKRVRSRKFVRRSKDGGVVEEVRVEVEMHDKKGALDSLAKALGLFDEQAGVAPFIVQVLGPVSSPPASSP